MPLGARLLRTVSQVLRYADGYGRHLTVDKVLLYLRWTGVLLDQLGIIHFTPFQVSTNAIHLNHTFVRSSFLSCEQIASRMAKGRLPCLRKPSDSLVARYRLATYEIRRVLGSRLFDEKTLLASGRRQIRKALACCELPALTAEEPSHIPTSYANLTPRGRETLQPLAEQQGGTHKPHVHPGVAVQQGPEERGQRGRSPVGQHRALHWKHQNSACGASLPCRASRAQTTYWHATPSA